MVFKTRVKYNGVHYPAGADVPITAEELDEYVSNPVVVEKPVEKVEPVKAVSTDGNLVVRSFASAKKGETAITVEPTLESGNKYKYKVAVDISLPTAGQNLRTWTSWNGENSIPAELGKKICIAEVDSEYKAVRSGIATVTAKS